MGLVVFIVVFGLSLQDFWKFMEKGFFVTWIEDLGGLSEVVKDLKVLVFYL